jgi:hypothetical protein
MSKIERFMLAERGHLKHKVPTKYGFDAFDEAQPISPLVLLCAEFRLI